MATERPILMSAPMVRATLEDRKTQTRRVVKPKAPESAQDAGVIGSDGPSNGLWCWLDSTDLEWASPIGDAFRCPYGLPGDRLWVREAHAIVPRTAYAHSDGVFQTLRPDDNHDACVYAEGWEHSRPGRWRPSIHMPRWASRITLEITDIRVERLNDISDVDAKAEGLSWVAPTYGIPGIAESWAADPVAAYAALWTTINGTGSWDANPWVWVVAFRRLSEKGDE